MPLSQFISLSIFDFAKNDSSPSFLNRERKGRTDIMREGGFIYGEW